MGKGIRRKMFFELIHAKTRWGGGGGGVENNL